MEKMDVTALGELLIDFTENGVSGQGNPLYEANPGGAPCNVLAMLSKLGHRTAFIGKVGNDFFGRQLKEAITGAGIQAKNLYMDETVHTTLAMVHTFPDGDRDFSFYREPGADMMLTAQEVPEEALENTRIFHFGTLSMTHEGVRAATKKAVQTAKAAGALISFDPNLRPPLWKSLEDAKEQVLYGLSRCDILKISDNEIQWLTGREDFTDGVDWILGRYNIPLILVSMGKQGSRAYYEGKMVEAAPFLRKDTIETTGAGDTFCGCVLHYVLEHGIKGLSEENLKEMLTFANCAASLITTKKGALKVMPEREEIEAELGAAGALKSVCTAKPCN
ncbi:MAG: carbohydrate kinase [Lachnospiraceae bacterium]|nr:carbohydrate kinase [Lachnospiraceae bacterium]